MQVYDNEFYIPEIHSFHFLETVLQVLEKINLISNAIKVILVLILAFATIYYIFRNKQNTLERKAVTALESNQKQAETKGDFDLSKKEPHRMRPMFRQFSDEGTPQPARQKAALLTV